MTIVDLDVTDKELKILFAGVIKNTDEYLERDRSEPYLTIDAVELYIIREQLDKAQELLDTIPISERLRFYPEGLELRTN